LKPGKVIVAFVVIAVLVVAAFSAASVAFYVTVGAPASGSKSYVIPSVGMAPTIVANDRVISDAGQKPVVGSVVAFDDPIGLSAALVKRVIATEGQTVDVQDGLVTVDGKPELAASIVQGPTQAGPESFPVTVPAGEVWAMGDNRPNSGDSRQFGPIPVDSIRGVVTFVYWPPSRFGPIAMPKPSVAATSAPPVPRPQVLLARKIEVAQFGSGKAKWRKAIVSVAVRGDMMIIQVNRELTHEESVAVVAAAQATRKKLGLAVDQYQVQGAETGYLLKYGSL
jgi:signal peptidase I